MTPTEARIVIGYIAEISGSLKDLPRRKRKVVVRELTSWILDQAGEALSTIAEMEEAYDVYYHDEEAGEQLVRTDSLESAKEVQSIFDQEGIVSGTTYYYRTTPVPLES